MYEFSEFKFFHHLDRFRAIGKKELPPPVTFEVDLTNACNHRCIWCADQGRNIEGDSTLKEIPFLNFAEEIAEQGVESIIFKGGGEPLLYYTFSKMVQDLKNLGFELGLFSNGETIHRHMQAIPHLSWISVCLDSATAQTHQILHSPFKTEAFHTIVDNLYQISTSVFTGVVFLLHPENIREMEAAAHLAKDVGCRYISYKRLMGNEAMSLSPQLMREAEDFLIKIKREQEDARFQVHGLRACQQSKEDKGTPYQVCLAHHLIGILASDGYLYPCWTLKGDLEYAYGSIYRDSFRDIWYGQKRKAILEKISKGECRDRCVRRMSYYRYSYYNQLLEYLTAAEEKVGHKHFL